MITVKTAKNNNLTIGVWIFDENTSGIFADISAICDLLEFSTELKNMQPGSEKTFGYINCSFTNTKQMVITDGSEFIIIEPEEIDKFINDIQEVFL